MQERRVGDYVARNRLGSGPFTETFLGEHLPSKQQVVLKRVHPALVAVPKICVRLRAQAISPPLLEHPRVAGLLAMHLDRDDVWLVGQYATGVPFEDTLFSPHNPDSIIPAFCRLLEAVDFSHRHGLVHANLKSTNLLVEPSGEFRLLDLAKSRLFGYSAITRDLLSAGVYRPPELINGDDIDARSDIYSLGKILLRLLGTVPGPFDAMIRRATAEDKEHRFRNIGEFRRALLERLPSPHLEEARPVGLERTVNPMSLIERIRKPIQSLLAKTTVVHHGHTVEGASVPIPAKVEPPATIMVSLPEPVPVPPRPKSLKESLACELVEFELPAAAPPPPVAPRPVVEPVFNTEPTEDPLEAGFTAFRAGDLARAKRLWLTAKQMDANNRIIDYNLRVVERRLAASNGR